MAGTDAVIEQVLKILLDKGSLKAIEEELKRRFAAIGKNAQQALGKSVQQGMLGNPTGYVPHNAYAPWSFGSGRGNTPPVGPPGIPAHIAYGGGGGGAPLPTTKAPWWMQPGNQAQMRGVGGVFGRLGQQAGGLFGSLSGLGGISGAALHGASGALATVGVNPVGAGAMMAGGLGAGAIAGVGVSAWRHLAQQNDLSRIQMYAGNRIASEAVRNRGSAMGFALGETTAMHTNLARATGNAGGLTSVMQLERALGLGSEGIGMLGASTRSGRSMNEREKTRELGVTIGYGMAQSLEKGRWGEMFQGITQFMHQATLGFQVSAASGGALATAIGRADSRYKGDAGFRVAQGWDAFAKGQAGTPVGQGIALRAAGFGSGTSYLDAMLIQEAGLTGTRNGKAIHKDGGVGYLRNRLNDYLGIAGGDEKLAAAYMKQDVPGSSMQSNLDLLQRRGSLTGTDVGIAEKMGTDQIAGAAAQINRDWKDLYSSIQKIDDSLADIGTQLAPLLAGILTFFGVSPTKGVADAIKFGDQHPALMTGVAVDFMGKVATGQVWGVAISQFLETPAGQKLMSKLGMQVDVHAEPGVNYKVEEAKGKAKKTEKSTRKPPPSGTAPARK